MKFSNIIARLLVSERGEAGESEALKQDIEAVKTFQHKMEQTWSEVKRMLDKDREETGKESAIAKEQTERAFKDMDDIKGRLDEMEKRAQRVKAQSESGGEQFTEAERRHADLYDRYIRQGKEGLSHEDVGFIHEQRALVLGNQASAGYLALPAVKEKEILKTITELDPLIDLATVKAGSAELHEVNKRDTTMSMTWVAEQGTRAETTAPTYGVHKIFAHEGYVQPHASRQMLMDSEYDLAGELGMDAGEAFAVGIGSAGISGNGVGRPLGITDSGSGVTAQTTITAATISGNDLLTMLYNLKEYYRNRSTWLMNRLIQLEVRKLKGGDGQYIWAPGLVPGQPSTLLGRPIRDATSLASTLTTGNNVAILGDYKTGYRFYRRHGIITLRDEITSKNTGTVEFDYYIRIGGKPVQTEALRYLQTS